MEGLLPCCKWLASRLEADCPLFGSRPWEPGLQSLTVTHDPCLGDGTGPAAHDAHDVEAALGGEGGDPSPVNG